MIKEIDIDVRTYTAQWLAGRIGRRWGGEINGSGWIRKEKSEGSIMYVHCACTP
jgi:hypothetical protein